MKKQRLTETQIVSILKQYDGGRDPMELCREYGISKATLYNWRKKYAGMDAAHLKEMKALQDENRRLKRLLAESMLDNTALKDLLGKNV